MAKKKALGALALGAALSLVGGLAYAAGTIDITAPPTGSTLPGTSATVTGNASASGTTGGPRTVTYLVDVSGSTSSPRNLDCNGDGVLDAGDNFNSDSIIGDVLDCEIASVLTLNSSLSSVSGLRVGVNAFGSSSVYADMGGGVSFVAPTATAEGANRVETVTRSLTSGRIGQYTPSSTPGTGTNFNNALASVIAAHGSETGEQWVFMMSDGQASVSTATLTALNDSGIKVRTFAVGTGTAGCATGSQLQAIAATTGETCTQVTDPSQLSAVFSGAPVDITSVSVTVDGPDGYSQTFDVTGSLNALGDWSTPELTGLAAGTYTATATATFTDGTTATDTSTFVTGPTATETPSATPSATPSVTPSATPSATKPSKHPKPGHSKHPKHKHPKHKHPVVIPTHSVQPDPHEGQRHKVKDRHGGLAKTGV